MIALPDLEGISREELVDILLNEKPQLLEICIYKRTVQFSTAPIEISYEYGELAYSGQRLNDTAHEFSYEEITPDVSGYVMFTVRTDNIDQLADTILDLAYLYGYISHPDDNYAEELQQSVTDYLYQVKGGALIPACPYFIQMCNQFCEEDEGDGWDDEGEGQGDAPL